MCMRSQALMDKVTVYGFRITDINNMIDLIRRNIVTVKQGASYYCQTADNKRFSSIRIEKTEKFDQLAYGIKPDGTEYGFLELSVPDVDGKHNLYGITAEDYRKQLHEAAIFLESAYGIVINIDGARYKQMEINKTIKLDQMYDAYQRPLTLLMYLLPGTLRLGGEHDVYRKDADHSMLQERRVKTFYKSSGKRGITIKIYDKTAQLMDEYGIKVEENFLRFEITLNCPDKVKKALGGNFVSEVDDAAIQAYFDAFILKNLIGPYEKYCEKSEAIIRKVLKKNYQPASRTWVRNTLLEISNMEIDKKVPVMLDITELTEMLHLLPFKTKQSRYNAKKNFEAVCRSHATVFCQEDGKKYVEILKKLS